VSSGDPRPSFPFLVPIVPETWQLWSIHGGRWPAALALAVLFVVRNSFLDKNRETSDLFD
jgi:hypothetical protein